MTVPWLWAASTTGHVPSTRVLVYQVMRVTRSGTVRSA